MNQPVRRRGGGGSEFSIQQASKFQHGRFGRRSLGGPAIKLVQIQGGSLADHGLNFRIAKHFSLHQRIGNFLKLFTTLCEQPEGSIVGFTKDPGNFFVNHLSRVFRVITRLGDLPAQEWMLIAHLESDGAQPLAHPPLGDHTPGQPSGLIKVLSRTSG